MFLYIEYLNDIFIIKLNYLWSFPKDVFKNKYLKYRQFFCQISSKLKYFWWISFFACLTKIVNDVNSLKIGRIRD